MYDFYQLGLTGVTYCSSCATEIILARALAKPKMNFKQHGRQNKSRFISEYDDNYDIIVGLLINDDLPLISCENHHGPKLSLKEVLRTSFGIPGENNMVSTGKLVLSKGRLCALKRFRKVTLRKREFCRRVERLAQVCNNCDYLVPVTYYLYAKKVKLLVCDYYPMGSLADLLSGGRNGQQTALNWKERLRIMICIARAIDFIHAQHSSPSDKRNMKINVHGNIKSSNIMIDIDLTARLSDYGFVQLVDDRVKDSDNQDRAGTSYCPNLNQKSDIFNFGLVLLDMLAGVRGSGHMMCIHDAKESIRRGENTFFECDVEGLERKQALIVLDIALSCTNRLPEARLSMGQILLNLSEVLEITM